MSLKVVIIGGVAAGPKAGCRIKRLDPSAEVVLIDRDELFSYGGCGIPYYVSGDVAELSGLRTTSFHMVRDEAFFRGAKGIKVLTGWEARAIDRGKKAVAIQELKSGAEERLGYDKLILATGSRPHIPDIPGLDLKGVWPVSNLHQAEAIKEAVARGEVGAAAVIGAGATGLEMAEALADLWGVEVHVFEMADQILPGVLDADVARFVESHLKDQDIHLHLNVAVERVVGGQGGGVKGVMADGQKVAVDMVILAAGVRPQSELAQKAGLELSERGAVRVNEHLQTSDPDIYAGGDCAANRCLITGHEIHAVSGSLANRHGRVIGTNVVRPNEAVFKGIVSSWIMKFFELAIARVGLTSPAAGRAGFEVVEALVVQGDRAHFYPGMELMYLKLIADKSSRRVLGCQCLSKAQGAVAARINAVAAVLPHRPTVADLANLEVAYAPPFAAAMDILNAAANTAENMIEGQLKDMPPAEFIRRLHDPRNEAVFLDVRDIRNATPYLKALGHRGWRHLPQESLAQRLNEVPRDKPLILICNSGVRSYEAQVFLAASGIEETYNLAGGVAAVKMSGEPILPPEKN